MRLFIIGFILVMVGVLLALVVPLVLLLQQASSGGVEVAGGGCVIIWFIPICFGVGSPVVLVVLAVVALVVAVALYLIHKLMVRELREALRQPPTMVPQ